MPLARRITLAVSLAVILGGCANAPSGSPVVTPSPAEPTPEASATPPASPIASDPTPPTATPSTPPPTVEVATTPPTEPTPSAATPSPTPPPDPTPPSPPLPSTWPQAFASHATISLNGDTYTLMTDAVPRHEYGPFPDMRDANLDGRPDNPNSVSAQSLTFRIPRAPTPASTPGPLGLGPIAIAVTGSPFFDARNVEGQDAVLVEVFDACKGHPEMRGLYHYHQASTCIANETAGGHSGIHGVSLDGYVIYGLNGSGGLPAAGLDACNGHTEPDLGYHYHLTSRPPYTIGCYHGTRLT